MQREEMKAYACTHAQEQHNSTHKQTKIKAKQKYFLKKKLLYICTELKREKRSSHTKARLPPNPPQPKHTVISNRAHRRTAQECLVGGIDRWQKRAVSRDENACAGLKNLVQWDAGILKALVRSLP